MNRVAYAALLLLFGIEFGWREFREGETEYIVQIDDDIIAALQEGHPITSTLPPELRNVRRIRIQYGSGELPKPHLAYFGPRGSGSNLADLHSVENTAQSNRPFDNNVERAVHHAPSNEANGSGVDLNSPEQQIARRSSDPNHPENQARTDNGLTQTPLPRNGVEQRAHSGSGAPVAQGGQGIQGNQPIQPGGVGHGNLGQDQSGAPAWQQRPPNGGYATRIDDGLGYERDRGNREGVNEIPFDQAPALMAPSYPGRDQFSDRQFSGQPNSRNDFETQQGYGVADVILPGPEPAPGYGYQMNPRQDRSNIGFPSVSPLIYQNHAQQAYLDEYGNPYLNPGPAMGARVSSNDRGQLSIDDQRMPIEHQSVRNGSGYPNGVPHPPQNAGTSNLPDTLAQSEQNGQSTDTNSSQNVDGEGEQTEESNSELANDSNRRGDPWVMTLFFLCVSIGANVYLGWIARGTYLRYRELADQQRRSHHDRLFSQ